MPIVPDRYGDLWRDHTSRTHNSNGWTSGPLAYDNVNNRFPFNKGEP